MRECVVAQVAAEVYHVIAERALFRELSEFVLVLFLDRLYLLAHLPEHEVELLVQFVELCVLFGGLMILLSHQIALFLLHADTLVERLDGLLEPVGVGEPVLLLELLHVPEVQLRDRGRAIL